VVSRPWKIALTETETSLEAKSVFAGVDLAHVDHDSYV
jgi:hypothetical protein